MAGCEDVILVFNSLGVQFLIRLNFDTHDSRVVFSYVSINLISLLVLSLFYLNRSTTSDGGSYTSG